MYLCLGYRNWKFSVWTISDVSKKLVLHIPKFNCLKQTSTYMVVPTVSQYIKMYRFVAPVS